MTLGTPPPGYRLPAATHLGGVQLMVTDLARSLDYYTRLLGLRVVARAAGSAALAAIDSTSPLVTLHTRPGVGPTRRGERLGLYHFALLLPDRAALGRFVAHLAATGTRIAASDHAVSEALYLWDPDGLGIEVYADRPRSEWKRRDQEVLMTIDPLDLGSLLEAAGGEAWDGMPNGTVLGHMHLHVGDLREGERLYHRALGLDKMVWSLPSALFVSAGGYHHHLAINTWAGNAAVPQDDEARLLEWEIVLPSQRDVQDAARSCEAAGYGVAWDAAAALVSDPWRSTFRMIAETDVTTTTARQHERASANVD